MATAINFDGTITIHLPLLFTMGRVARYKKVKACDPFSKENKRKSVGGEAVWGLGDDGRKAKKRSRTSEKLRAQRKKKTKLDKFVDREFDAPPGEADEFDMTDLVGSLKKNTNAPESEIIRISPSSSSIPKAPALKASNLEDEQSANRLLKVEKQILSKAEPEMQHGRMEGESKNAYRRRFANETRQLIKREKMELHNPEKRQRKKEFLNNKKKKRKGNNGNDEFDAESDELDVAADEATSTIITGEQAYAKRALETQVHFGEQAERPPSFKQLPRKATPKPAPKTMGSIRSGNEIDIEAQKAEMELMRRKVRAQYALIKARRHHQGDFHL
jgi:hypothetical protein